MMNIKQRSIEIAHEFSPECKGSKVLCIGPTGGKITRGHSAECKELALKIRVLVDEAVRLQNEAWQKSQMGRDI